MRTRELFTHKTVSELRVCVCIDITSNPSQYLQSVRVLITF